jgi:Zn finger protein HypA/HybF involved in hydrogenase expression
MPDGLPTPRTTLRAAYVRVLLTCWSCKRQHDADLDALVAAGRGDVPLVQLRRRCSWCHSTRIEVVMAKDSTVVPWREARRRVGQAPAGP